MPSPADAYFEATVSVIRSTDHYRAARLARLFDELAGDTAGIEDERLRERFAQDAELAREHAAELKEIGRR